jgi:DNA-binding CsgD family transcriptional regulator
VNVIIFGQFKKACDWMADEINIQPGPCVAVPVTTAEDYKELATQLKDFALIVGQYKLADYQPVEAALAQECIFPERRIVCAASVSALLLQWASDQFYDGVIDLVNYRKTFAPDAVALLTAEKGNGSASVGFPLTTALPLMIPYRDSLDEDIVRLISYGFSNVEIAASTRLSVQTVRNRISQLLTASGARNRTQLSTIYLLQFTTFNEGESHPRLTLGSEVPNDQTEVL